MEYRSFSWGEFGVLKRERCPDKEDHKPHSWIRGSDLTPFQCNGWPPPIPRCNYQQYSNTRCLLKEEHGGAHMIPCINSAAHGPHPRGGRDEKGNLYECPGHRFDYT